MTGLLRLLTAVALLAVLAVAGGGCGRSSSSGETDAGRSPTVREKAVAFAECMRENGVAAFPDPDASGTLTLDGVVNGSSIDSDGAAWKQATTACESLEPPGFAGHTRTAGQQRIALAFAQCIRDNGVEDFPDPTRDSPMIDTRRIPSAGTKGGMSLLHAAMQACREVSAPLTGGA